VRLALLLVLAVATAACGWEDVTGDRDMPWLGGGGRARWFRERSTCLMCPTGSREDDRWGRSRWTGEDPWATVAEVTSFLARSGALARWPEAFGEGSAWDGSGEPTTPRAVPYRFTIVMLEPTVVVMRFDLGAMVGAPGPDAAQTIGTARLTQAVEYGTRLPATGTLLWFSPDADQAPTPVTLSSPDAGTITVGGTRLALTRRGDVWDVARAE
jgi:hypothetical protein